MPRQYPLRPLLPDQWRQATVRLSAGLVRAPPVNTGCRHRRNNSGETERSLSCQAGKAGCRPGCTGRRLHGGNSRHRPRPYPRLVKRLASSGFLAPIAVKSGRDKAWVAPVGCRVGMDETLRGSAQLGKSVTMLRRRMVLRYHCHIYLKLNLSVADGRFCILTVAASEPRLTVKRAAT